MKKYILTLLICFFLPYSTAYLRGQAESLPTERSAGQKNAAEQPEIFPSSDSNHGDFDSIFSKSERDVEDFHTKFTNMLGILVLLITFMLLASWMIKKMMRTRVTQLNTQSSIKVLETRFLSPKSTLYLLDVMGQGLLIAESSAGIHQLTKIRLTSDEEIGDEFSSEKLS